MLKAKRKPTLRELEYLYIIAVYNNLKVKFHIADALGVSVRTIYNRLDTMQAEGIAEYDEIRDTYKMKVDYFKCNPFEKEEEPVKQRNINEICNEIYALKYGDK